MNGLSFSLTPASVAEQACSPENPNGSGERRRSFVLLAVVLAKVWGRV